jgi:Asp-tRNA(Asn)/Glu-tRNA(Gln) amidotransferase A subunit family amidase
MEKSISELQAAMEAGQVTSRGLVEIYLARIAAYDKQGPAINAMIALNPQALAAAEGMDAERKAGRVRGPLHGIPIVVKDNYETVEMPTTVGSIALASFHPASDAFQVQRLKNAGAVIVGKTNMHELASGITNIGSSGGQTRNPYDLGRNPGGSSGGTGAAVAANFAVAGMGSDTCGSIRNPASHNNLVGLRGTRGLSSRTGIVPLSSTQDIGGPIARSIADLAIMLDATVGADAADVVTSASAGHIPKSYRDALSSEALKGSRIGVLRSLFGATPEDQEVTGVVNKALEAMKKAGAETIDVAVPGLDDLLRGSSLIDAEFKFDFADYLARQPSAPVRSLGEILERGLYHAALESSLRARNAVEKRESEQYRRAMIKRAAIRQAVEAVLQEHRLAALAYPTLRRKPARIGDAQPGSNCQLSAASGLPALGLAVGWTDDGLPIGVDLLGAAFNEPQLLALGYAFEHAAKVRQAPFSAPALVAGKAPVPKRLTGAFGELVFDSTTSRLTYKLDVGTLQRDGVTAVWIHRASEKPGAALHQLFGGAATAPTGTLTFSYADRRDLAAGHLVLRAYSRRTPSGGESVKLAFPPE